MHVKYAVQIALLLVLATGAVTAGKSVVENPRPIPARVIQPSLPPVVVEVPVTPAAVVEPELVDSTAMLRLAGLQLARQGVNEANFETPHRDIDGILQVAYNIQRKNETIFETLQRLSPRVARLKPPSMPRQEWTSTLPASGTAAPELWIECPKGSELPGCSGVWELVVDRWVEIRQYSARLVRTINPPKPVQGTPVTWGGLMDIWRVQITRPNLCLLESGDTRNYFFGEASDPNNQCKHVSAELLAESKALYKRIEFKPKTINTATVPARLARGG